jgi:predicted alpha/beta hydrolase
MSAAMASVASSPVLPGPGASAVAAEEVAITTADGRALAGRLHLPAGAPRHAILIHGGAGIPARYYQDFAAWLCATHAAAVLTYDYRDFGWSQQRPLRESDATFSDWGLRDQSAALSFLARRYADLPMRIVGHSLGAQWLAFHDDVARIDRVAAVASGPAFWRHHPLSYMPAVIAFWWLIGPAATKALGYLPGRAIGLGADLPAGVYWEWRKVCVTPGFHQPEWGHSLPTPRLDAARFDLTLLPAADDQMIPPAVVRRLPRFYPQARVSETLLDPAALGCKKIGHVGAFHIRNRACWTLIADPLVR